MDRGPGSEMSNLPIMKDGALDISTAPNIRAGDGKEAYLEEDTVWPTSECV